MTSLINFWGLDYWRMPDGSLKKDIKFSAFGGGGIDLFSECKNFKESCFLILGSLDFE